MTENAAFPLGFVESSVPAGTHMVLLYETEDDLLEILPTFIAAGLNNNEACIVVYPHEDFIKKMEKQLCKLLPLDQHRERLKFMHYKEFYFKGSKLDIGNVFHLIDKKLEDADYHNVDGIRAMGDMSWIFKSKDFNQIVCYENELTKKYFNQGIIVLCSYPLKKCNPSELIEVIQSHMLILYRKGGVWKISETVQRQLMNAKIEDLKQFNRLAVDRELKMIELKKRIHELEAKHKDS